MKRLLAVTSFLFVVTAVYSQSKEIIGSWICRDSIGTIQIFIKANGTIEERNANANENVWDKAPRTGTYTYDSKGKLIIMWTDKSSENRLVKFKNHSRAADFQFMDQKGKAKRTYLFLRIVDEEVISN